jgi:hypothetical protein
MVAAEGEGSSEERGRVKSKKKKKDGKAERQEGRKAERH